MNHFLVPTDFSENALNASYFAMELANEFRAKITLLNVYHIPNPLIPLPVELIFTPDELKSDTDSALKQQRMKLLNANNRDIEIDCMSRNGFSVKEINDAASYLNADLIIMGMRGAGVVRETIMGSITTSIIESTLKPLLIIPQQCSFKKPVNIAVVNDEKTTGKDADHRILVELANQFGALVHVLNINHTKENNDENDFFENIKRQLTNGTLSSHFIESNKVNESIQSFIHENKIDLLAMHTHKPNLFQKLFSLSHTKQLAFHADLPLLVLHRVQ